MNDHQINLSIIREDKQPNNDNEGLDQLLIHLKSHKKGHLENEREIGQFDGDLDDLMDSQLTAKLKTIRRYVQSQGRMDLGEHLMRKFQNLVRCVRIHQTSLKEDYILLFEILLATCQRSITWKSFLHQLAIATSKWQPSGLSQDYMGIIYELVRMNMEGYHEKNEGVDKLRSYCMKIGWKGGQWFPLRDILRTHFGFHEKVNNMQSLGGLGKQLSKEKPRLGDEYVKHSVKLQNQVEQTNQGSSKIQLPKPKLQISRFVEQISQGKHPNNQYQDSINTISLRQIKKSPQGKAILRKRLDASFTNVKLMSCSIETALYIFQIQEFINEIKYLFQLHTSNQNLPQVKRIIKNELKKYSGKDGLYYWSKIQL